MQTVRLCSTFLRVALSGSEFTLTEVAKLMKKRVTVNTSYVLSVIKKYKPHLHSLNSDTKIRLHYLFSFCLFLLNNNYTDDSVAIHHIAQAMMKWNFENAWSGRLFVFLVGRVEADSMN